MKDSQQAAQEAKLNELRRLAEAADIIEFVFQKHDIDKSG